MLLFKVIFMSSHISQWSRLPIFFRVGEIIKGIISIRQLHSWMSPVSIVSLFSGALVGFLVIFIFNLPKLAFMIGYSSKYLVEIVCYSLILYRHSRSFGNLKKSIVPRESQSKSILKTWNTRFRYLSLQLPIFLFLTAPFKFNTYSCLLYQTRLQTWVLQRCTTQQFL